MYMLHVNICIVWLQPDKDVDMEHCSVGAVITHKNDQRRDIKNIT